jgi:CO/xanthine dehydrogenase Mo-binding subunit
MLFDRIDEHAVDSTTGGSGAPVSRRTFLMAGAAVSGGLLIGVGFGAAATAPAKAADAAGSPAFSPNAFVRIDPDGQVTVTMGYIEMGQGTYTSVPMLIAEELEVDLASVRYEHAPPNDKLYANPLLGFQVTGGSTTIRASWEPMRRAGATARVMLVTAAASAWKVDPASCHAEKGEVIHAASGRRVKYGALVAAAAKLPVPEQVALKRPEDFKLIGTAAKRLDTPAKVNGTARFGIDAQVPGMKIATLVSSPVFGGKLRSVDDTKALAVRGVRKVVRLDDAVAVIADHMGAAKKGLAALDIQWDDGPNAKLQTADIVRELEAAANTKPGAVARNEGDADKALAGAATRVEAVYEVPFLAHATMEPMNCTVDLRADHCELWLGNQVLARAQAAAAQTAGLPLEKVTVHNHLLGGGFGRRLEVDYVIRAVQIAKQAGGPVKVIWTREEDMRRGMYRPYFYFRFAAGLDAQGQPVAWKNRIVGSSILARWAPPLFENGYDRDAVECAAEPPYALSNIFVDYVQQEPPGIPTAFWRGVGPTRNVFAVESFIDELAAAARQDPVAYRRGLLAKNPRAKAVLELAAEKAGWAQGLPKGTGRGVAVQFAFGSYMAQVAEVEVGKEGDVLVRRVVCAVDCGTVVNPDTVAAQIESGIIFGISATLHGAITLKDGRVEQSNFNDYRVVRMNEAPMIEIHIVKSGQAPGGMGEPGTSALAPAVTNAIYAATGKRLRKLPVDGAQLRA